MTVTKTLRLRGLLGSLLGGLLTAVGLALGGCDSGTACDLDAVLRQRAGAGAANCGHVAVDAPSMTTDQCIDDQTARGAAFYARYELQGIDSRVTLGAMRDAQGRSSVLLWDSDPSGGSMVGARIERTVCGGEPPVRTMLTDPGAVLPVSCTVEMSMDVICGG